MPLEQDLIGAMGCASWRVRQRYREYAELSPEHGGSIGGGGKNPPYLTSADSWGLNEVGLTDAVMAALWHFGAGGAAFAVRPHAESIHLGADIALLHRESRRILLYQAKIARLSGNEFELKSKLTAEQAKRLRRATVALEGIDYRITGRLALYQFEHHPFLSHCRSALIPVAFDPDYWCSPFASLGGPCIQPAPEIGRWYYDNVLRGPSCSPSGIVAAPVVGSGELKHLSVGSTWPWEFDAHEWLNCQSRLDDPGWPTSSNSEMPEFGARPPRPDTDDQMPPEGSYSETAQALAEELGLPKRWILYLIVV